MRGTEPAGRVREPLVQGEFMDEGKDEDGEIGDNVAQIFTEKTDGIFAEGLRICVHLCFICG